MNSKIFFCVLFAVSTIGVLKATPAEEWADQDEADQDDQDDEIVSQDEIQATLDESLMMDEADVQEDSRVTLKGRRSETISVFKAVRNLGPQYTTCLRAQREPLRKVRSDTRAAYKKCRADLKDKATCEQAAIAVSAEPLGKVLFDLAQCVKDTTIKSSGVTRSWFKKIRKALGRVINFGRKICGKGFGRCISIAKSLAVFLG